MSGFRQKRMLGGPYVGSMPIATETYRSKICSKWITRRHGGRDVNPERFRSFELDHECPVEAVDEAEEHLQTLASPSERA